MTGQYVVFVLFQGAPRFLVAMNPHRVSRDQRRAMPLDYDRAEQARNWLCAHGWQAELEVVHAR